MTRLSALAAHPRRTLGALGVVLAAAGLAVGSGANFTASSANPANTFTAGTLSIGNTPSSAFLAAGNMKPGDTTTGTVDIQNTGSVPGTFSLKTSNATDSSPSMLGQLDLRVRDCGVFTGSTAPTCDSNSTSVYNGKISGLSTAASLGSFPSSAKHRYQFDVTLPSSTDDAYQGKTASVQFNWNAVTA
jgi:spore coat-associated protein N